MKYWKTQFSGDYNVPNYFDKYKDMSYGNDVCPSFAYGHLRIWVDHPNKDMREGDYKRYSIHLMDDDMEFVCALLETDDLEKTVGWLELYKDKYQINVYEFDKAFEYLVLDSRLGDFIRGEIGTPACDNMPMWLYIARGIQKYLGEAITTVENNVKQEAKK